MRYKHAVDETHDSHEESGNESERNNQRNNDSSDDDSDCSSELDEKECEYRRAFCLGILLLFTVNNLKSYAL